MSSSAIRFALAGAALSVLAFSLTCKSLSAQDAPQPQPAPSTSPKPPTPVPEVSPPKAGSSDSAPQPHDSVPASAERHFRAGVSFEHDGNVENAIAEYKEAIKEYPDYFEAHFSLGNMYLDH